LALDIALRISELLTSLSRLHIVAKSGRNVDMILAEFQGAVSALAAYLQLLNKEKAQELRRRAYQLDPEDEQLLEKASALADEVIRMANQVIKIAKNREPFVGI